MPKLTCNFDDSSTFMNVTLFRADTESAASTKDDRLFEALRLLQKPARKQVSMVPVLGATCLAGAALYLAYSVVTTPAVMAPVSIETSRNPEAAPPKPQADFELSGASLSANAAGPASKVPVLVGTETAQ